MTTYWFNITQCEDEYGLPLIDGIASKNITFTTGDFTNPIITNTNPACDSTDVALDTNIVVTFSEPMKTSTLVYSCEPSVPSGFTTLWDGTSQTVTFQHINSYYYYY